MIPGPPSRHLVTAGHVDDVDGVVDELAAVLRRQIVPPDSTMSSSARLVHQLFERQEVR